jgi:hypothetical protein
LTTTPDKPTDGLGAGARLALSQIASCIKRDRLDIRVREWARRIADPHPTVAAKVAAIAAAFEAMSDETPGRDNWELATSSAALIGKPSRDSDDAAATLGAAFMSLGMNVKVVMLRAPIAKHDDPRLAMLMMYLQVRDESGQWIDVNRPRHSDNVLRAPADVDEMPTESETLLGRSASAGHGCGDCAVEEGKLHKLGCDMERCPFCGHQLISCGCDLKHFYPEYTSLHEAPPTPDSMLTAKERAHAKRCRVDDCPQCTAIRASGKTHGLPVRVYFDGLPEDKQAEWERKLEARGRIPWICYPNTCRRCGVLWPKMFRVSDEEWEHYVEPAMRGYMLCEECYTWIKQQIDEARRERG